MITTPRTAARRGIAPGALVVCLGVLAPLCDGAPDDTVWRVTDPAPFAAPPPIPEFDPSGVQQSWDVRAQFSTTANPNGQWTYGYSLTRLTPLVPAVFADQSVQSGVYDWYTLPLTPFPGVLYSVSASTLTLFGSTVTLPAAGVGLQPGSLGEFATVQWTCPTNGQYNISAQFTGRSTQTFGYSEVSILRNGLPLFYSVIHDPRQIALLTTTLDMTVGETLAFAVGKGADGPDKDLKSLDCVIQRVPRLCIGDINGDGIVNSSDVGILLNKYGQAVPPSDAGDLDGNGVVDSRDLAMMLANYGCTS